MLTRQNRHPLLRMEEVLRPSLISWSLTIKGAVVKSASYQVLCEHKRIYKSAFAMASAAQAPPDLQNILIKASPAGAQERGDFERRCTTLRRAAQIWSSQPTSFNVNLITTIGYTVAFYTYEVLAARLSQRSSSSETIPTPKLTSCQTRPNGYMLRDSREITLAALRLSNRS